MLPYDYDVEKNFLYKRIAVEGSKYIRLMCIYDFSINNIEANEKIVVNAYRVIKKSLSSRERLVIFGNLKFPKVMEFLSKLKK